MSESPRLPVVFPVVQATVATPPWLTRTSSEIVNVAFPVRAGTAPAAPEEAPPEPEVDAQADEPANDEPQPEPEDPLADARATLAAELEALDAMRAELEEQKRAFSDALADLASFRHKTLHAMEGELLDLAIVVARSILEAELEKRPELHVALARAALSQLVPSTGTVLRLGSRAADVVEEALGTEFEHEGVTVRVARDPTLADLGCVVESPIGRVDALVEERLEHVREALETASQAEHHESAHAPSAERTEETQ